MKKNEQINSKNSMFGHSEVKVKLLREYMAAYLGILSNTRWIKDVYLFDLFCGPGIYENGGKGSPVVFLEEIKKANDFVSLPRGRDTRFHCRFNDLDEGRIAELKENVTDQNLNLGNHGDIQYSNDEYKTALKEANNTISSFKDERGFVFIDPYGYSDISLNDISRILQSGKMEVLLFMPTHFMYRFKENATPDALDKFLVELDITEQVKGINGLGFVEMIRDGFQRKLGCSTYVDSFVLERELNQFFCLFFFTSNRLGFLKMLEAKWKIDKEEGRGWTNDAGGGLFAQTSSANTLKLKNLLCDFLRKGYRSNESIFQFTIDNRYLPVHSTELLKEFERDGVIEIETLANEKRRKGAFYLSSEAVRKNPDKISVKLKK